MSLETSPRRLLDRLQLSLARDHDLPAGHKVVKALRYGAATALAPLYLAACDRVGPGARTRGRPLITNAGRLELGARANLGSMFAPVQLSTGPRGTLRIGDDAAINFGCSISATHQVTLGDRVSLGPYVTIADSDSDPTTDSGPTTDAGPRPILIGNDVWLAARVRVRAGAVIGDGSVITAGSEVVGEIPAGVIAGGIPARVLRQTGTDPGTHAPADPNLHPTSAAPSAPTPITTPTAPSAPSAAPSAPTAPTAPTAPITAPPTPTAPMTAPPTPTAKTPAPERHGLLLADFSIQELAHHLRAPDPLGPPIDATVASFDQVVQTLAQLDTHVATHHADFAVVWTRPEGLASFRDLLLGREVKTEDLLAEVDAFAARLQAAAPSIKHLFVPTWILPPYERGLGMIDMREGGAARALLRMNLRLAEALDAVPNVFLLDANRWAFAAPMPSKLWFLGKVAFSAEVFAEAAKDIRAALRGLAGAAKKLVVLDLDDTLWGGIVGDVGWENLHLGGHDALGEAYVELQHRLQALTRRGVLLALVSKNEESTALEAIAKHPAMVLKIEDFAAHRINWRDKAANIADLVAELNLGLQSVVFLDDSPVERARVREALPEVFVPELPDDKLLYPQTLLTLRCFDTPLISKEDIERTRMYAAERGRDALKKEVGSLDDWLAGLGMKVRFARLDAGNLARTTQLLNKTNQMNLRTRRLGEAELSAWAAAPGHELWTLSVSDRFGDAGLTGILGLELDGPTVHVTDYILSCRVMARRVEETMLCAAIHRAKELGATTVEAELLATAKNKPCLGFFQKSGFDADATGHLFRWPLDRPYPLPPVIEASGLDLATTPEARHV